MKKKTVGSLLVGTLAGIGIGVLFAPRKGSETRKMLSKKLDELYKQVKELDRDEVKVQIEEKINEIKDDLKDLDKEKALKLAKEKASDIKVKIEELGAYAKDKATPVVEKTIEDLRKTAIKATKEITKKLEEKDLKKEEK